MADQIITPNRLRQLCDFDVPYSGAIKIGNNALLIADTKMRHTAFEHQQDSPIYYNKTIIMNMKQGIHIVKKGENTWSIAQKWQVSEAELLAKNPMLQRRKTPGMIYPNDTLIIPIGKKYSASVSMNVPQKVGMNVRGGLSNDAFYMWLNYAQMAANNLWESTHHHVGNTRIGFSRQTHLFTKIYYPTSQGFVFKGNPTTETFKLTNYLKQKWLFSNMLPGIGISFGLLSIADGMNQDGGRFGKNAVTQTYANYNGAVYGAAGAEVASLIANKFASKIPAKIISRALGGFAFGAVAGILTEAILKEGLKEPSDEPRITYEERKALLEEFRKKYGYGD